MKAQKGDIKIDDVINVLCIKGAQNNSFYFIYDVLLLLKNREILHLLSIQKKNVFFSSSTYLSQTSMTSMLRITLAGQNFLDPSWMGLGPLLLSPLSTYTQGLNGIQPRCAETESLHLIFRLMLTVSPTLSPLAMLSPGLQLPLSTAVILNLRLLPCLLHW